MKRCTLLAVTLLTFGEAMAETDCEAVIAATLDELRLGSSGQWTAAEEGTARAAAGSACLKASSGRYGDTLVVESIGVASGGATELQPAGGDSGREPDEEESGGIRFTPMSGSPGQKPYERSRSVDN